MLLPPETEARAAGLCSPHRREEGRGEDTARLGAGQALDPTQ